MDSPTGTTAPTNPPPPAPDPRRWQVLALLGTAFFIVILDSTIVYVAVPSIQEQLGFTAASVQWVLSTYLLTFGGLLLFGGRMADLLGRRRIFMAGIVLFALSSLLCGLAWSAEVLLTARVAQGIGAAIMAPTALSLLLTTFGEGPDRNKALGIWGGIGGVGGTAGLLLGGPVTQLLGWEWIFFINVPLGIVLLIGCGVLLRESRNLSLPRNFDAAGAVTVTLALVLLVYGITEAPTTGWNSPRTWTIFAASALLLTVFVFIELRSAYPLMPLRVLRSRRLVGGNIVLLTAGMSVDGILIVLTLYSQDILDASALQFGLATAVMTVMSVVGSFAGQAIVTRKGFQVVAAAGMTLIAVGSLVLSRLSAQGGPLDNLLLGLLIFGAGLGAAFVGAQISALSGAADSESGLAAGIADTCFTLGGALGLAVLSTVAASHAATLIDDGVAEKAALTSGFQTALLVAVGFAAVGLIAAISLLRQPLTLNQAESATESAAEPPALARS
jgi:EmrB/QacA subfamily drug resistance transporter